MPSANFMRAWLPWMPSFWQMLLRWVSTVRGLMKSSSPIALLVL